jgi:putative transposase
MEYYRNLPHLHPIESVFFITIRLAGSLPVAIIEMLKEEQEMALRQVSKQPEEVINQRKRYFARFDASLDKPQNGPYWLKEVEIAGVIKEALHFRDKLDYRLVAYCLMSNHMHVVIDTREAVEMDKPLFQILQSFKRYTARKANMLLNRTGAFWHPESYDHIVRDNGELRRVIWYVIQNPVKAGLCREWTGWPHSYVNEAYLI